MASICSVEGCDREVRARGWCGGHLDRWYKTGDTRPEKPIWIAGRTVEERFWDRVELDPLTGCWVWSGGTDSKGYSTMRGPAGKTVRGHRYSYELLVGPIPEGYVIDHLCRNRACVNPAHLEAVTNAENIRRSPILGMKQLARTHCKHGHPWDAENTRISRSNGQRCCRACERASRDAAKLVG